MVKILATKIICQNFARTVNKTHTENRNDSTFENRNDIAWKTQYHNYMGYARENGVPGVIFD